MKTAAQPLSPGQCRKIVPHGTTGIGSLPHHNVDAALEFAFRMKIPFLPQIPLRNPWEYMIAQALEGLPGLQVESGGELHLPLSIWKRHRADLARRLDAAFSRAEQSETAFEDFEPSASVSSSWLPFLWELQERGSRIAKIQIAGPMTAQWAIETQGEKTVEDSSELSSQIFRLVLARALAMSRKLRSIGVQPLIFLDEPGLFAYSPTQPQHVFAMQELRLVVQSLKKDGAWVGLHCCSNTDWKAVLALGIDLLSLDLELSLESLLHLNRGDTSGGVPPLSKFFQSGGNLALGVIQTSPEAHASHAPWNPQERLTQLRTQLDDRTIRNAVFTPACGLALHSVADAEAILNHLQEFHALATSFPT